MAACEKRSSIGRTLPHSASREVRLQVPSSLSSKALSAGPSKMLVCRRLTTLVPRLACQRARAEACGYPETDAGSCRRSRCSSTPREVE